MRNLGIRVKPGLFKGWRQINGMPLMLKYLFFRMERTTLLLWLLLLGTLMPQGCCQHWSYGLSPGGKRELDSLSDTLASVSINLSHTRSSACFISALYPCNFVLQIVGAFPQTDVPCSVLGCAEESPFAKLHTLRGLLVSVAPLWHFVIVCVCAWVYLWISPLPDQMAGALSHKSLSTTVQIFFFLFFFILF